MIASLLGIAKIVAAASATRRIADRAAFGDPSKHGEFRRRERQVKQRAGGLAAVAGVLGGVLSPVMIALFPESFEFLLVVCESVLRESK